MGYNGHANWATWEARNWFGETITEAFENAADGNTENEAREAFADSLKEIIEDALDADLRQNGLDSSMLGLAAEAGNIDYDDLFSTELGDNPGIFDGDDDDDGDSDAPSGPRM